MTKGSDSVLTKLLAPIDETTDAGLEQKLVRQQTLKSLQDHAEEGLRTLLICERVITQDFYDAWLEKYNRVQKETGRKKTEKLDKICLILESDFIVLGSTGLQDNLQEGVVESIRKL